MAAAAAAAARVVRKGGMRTRGAAAAHATIEVEVKCAPPADVGALRRRVEGLQGRQLRDVEFRDVYVDTARSFELSQKDTWLRLRAGTWELKLPLSDDDASASRTGGEREVFREVVSKDAVAAALAEGNAAGVGCEEAWRDALGRFEKGSAPRDSPPQLEEIAAYTTHRLSFHVDGCSVDVDVADYGHGILEVEKVVNGPGDVAQAREDVARVAEAIGASPLPPDTGGKLEAYLRRFRPDVIAVLVANGILS